MSDARPTSQRDHDEQFLKLAQARYDVGRASLIDVRQAQVARGAAEVALLRARTAVQVEKLRLFQQIGVSAPVDLATVQLTDTFSVQTPSWRLPDLLGMAEQQNPSLKALRERERAAGWGVKAASSSWGPSVSLSAGWSGFTQKLSDINPTIGAIRASAQTDSLACAYENAAWLNAGQTPLNCAVLTNTVAPEQALRDRNTRYPFHFTPQPFQARLTVTIPLWGNFQQPLQVSQAKAQQQDLQESVRARGLQVQTDVSQAYLTLETAFQTIAIQDTNRTARRDGGQEVRFEPTGRRALVAAVTASGKIQPKKKVDVSADITGRITRIAVREGDLVKQGQFLIQIDPTIYEANLQQASATMASAQAAVVQAKTNQDQSERALRRTKELHTQSPNLISQEQLEQAQTAYDVAEANLNAAQHQVDQARAAVQSARDNLRKTTLIAPMTGRVTRLAVEEGEVAVPSTFSKDIGLLLTVSDLSVIQAKVKVDETDVVRVHLSDSVEVSIDAFPDTVFIGRVTKVSDSSVRDATATATGQSDRAVDYEVEITLDKPPTDIRPDLSATARIVTDTRKQALSIPIIALTVRENKPGAAESRPADTAAARKKKETEGVFVVKDGLANFRPVKVGVAGDEYFEVTDGLKPGETIVAGPDQAVRDLKEGARVRAMKQPADSAKKKAAS